MALTDQQQQQLLDAVARLDQRREQDADLPQRIRETHGAIGRVEQVTAQDLQAQLAAAGAQVTVAQVKQALRSVLGSLDN